MTEPRTPAAKLNEYYDRLADAYLFPEIARRTKAFQAANPDVKIFRLGIGNTTEPLTPTVIAGLHHGVDKLARVETYTGYGEEQGDNRLRKAIAEVHYKPLGVSIDPLEVFVGCGAKDDVANIQQIFSLDNIVAVQDPAYPVYVDTNIASGRGGVWDETRRLYTGLVYMQCTKENGFIPNPAVLEDHERRFGEIPSMIYLCSPNNPTGAVMNHLALAKQVEHARRKGAVIFFDAAYSAFIKDPSLPRSIYEIPGAQDCAIEFQSFSKSHGFTGVRSGWTVVPKGILNGKANAKWNRRSTTFFNGDSNIAQEGALAALSEQGLQESRGLVNYYMENAKEIRNGLNYLGIEHFGGVNAPFILMETPNRMDSWEFFDKLLQEAHVVSTPGAGFGPSGEGYMRLSAFGHRENIEKAVDSIKRNLKR